MKFLLTPMKLRRTRNKSCAGRLLFLFLALGLFFPGFLILNGRAGAAPKVEDEDVIVLLSQSLGGRDLAFAAWVNMGLAEKQALRDQAVRIASMAQAAEQDGISASADVERVIRWGTNALLAQAWEKKIEKETNLSEEALRSFYEMNLQRYLDTETVRYRQVLFPGGQKETALRVKRQLQKASLSRLKNCVTVDWMEYGKLEPPLAGELRTAPLNKVMGPVKISDGQVLYEVLERRKEGPIPFVKCRGRVREDMLQMAIKERLEKLDRLDRLEKELEESEKLP